MGKCQEVISTKLKRFRKSIIMTGFFMACSIAAGLYFQKNPKLQPIIESTVTTTSIITLPPLPQEPTSRSSVAEIKKYVDVPAGAIDWKVFGKTTETKTIKKASDGQKFQLIEPNLSKDLQVLNNKEISIKGFMFPLDQTEKQSAFLFGPFPINCPFHYHVGPSLVIEVHADKHLVPFSYDAITIKGRLQLVPNNEGDTLFYRLIDAKQIE